MSRGHQVNHGDAYAQASAPAKAYEYTTLIDILKAFVPVHFQPSTCNVYGRVEDCTMPRPTARDWMSNVRLSDPSTAEHPELEGGVEVLMFAALPESLPTPDSVGSIMRLHRLQAKEYNGQLQLVASVGNKRKCQYCLFSAEAAEGEPHQPYFSSSTNYTMNDHEANLVDLLRTFMAAATELPAITAPNKYLMKIRDLDPKDMWDEKPDGTRVPNTFFDICCKVLHVHGDQNCKVMYVWDGTDARPFPPGGDTRNDFVEDPRLPQDDREQLMSMMQSYLPLQECEEVPRLGTAMPVVTYGLGKLSNVVPLPEAGQWVKLRNVAACLINGQLQGLYRTSSKWAPWKPTPEALQVLDRREAEGIVAEWSPTNPTDLLATTFHPNVPFETIREVHRLAVHGSGTKHRCLVQVVGYVPDEITSFCHQAQACSMPGVDGDYVYTVRLLLRDATGLIDGLVFAEAGRTFFQGIPAQDLSAAQEAAKTLDRAMLRLMGYNADMYEGAWIECCLSGYSHDRSNPLDTRHYRIFDTQLRPDLLMPAGPFNARVNSDDANPAT